MSQYPVEDMFRDINSDAENYLSEMKRMRSELDKYTDYVENVFDRKFKIKGIVAKVDDYSIHNNWIDIFPASPDYGVDCLTLTFREFARLVEFLD